MKNIYITIKNFFSILPRNYFFFSILILSISIAATTLDLTSVILIGKIVLFIQNGNLGEIGNFSFISRLSFNQLIITYICISISAGSAKIIFTFLSTKFAAKCGSYIANKVFSITLRQSYIKFVESNNSDTLSLITKQLDNTTTVIREFFVIGSYFVNAMLMTLLVTRIIPKHLFFVLTIAPLIYITISSLMRKRILYISDSISELIHKQMQFSREVLDMKKDITINNNFNLFEKQFYKNEFSRRLLEAEITVKQVIPRSVIEVLIVMGLVYVINFYSNNDGLIFSTIISLGLAIQKLLPSLQGMYAVSIVINAYSESVKRISDYVHGAKPFILKDDSQAINSFESLKINNLSYKYPGAKNKLFKNLSLEINKGEFIAIKGLSGAGKSTLMDLLIGLIKDESNSISINNINLNNCTNSWYQQIQYVGQSNFFIDGSIIENVLLGNKNKIKDKELSFVLENTGLKSVFKESNISINDRIGEYGNLISRGQKQRVGLARALLRLPNVIFLDEASNGLDIKSEKQLYKNLRKFKNLTLISITHSQSTDECFDKIIELK